MVPEVFAVKSMASVANRLQVNACPPKGSSNESKDFYRFTFQFMVGEG